MSATTETPREWRGIEATRQSIEDFLTNPTRGTLINYIDELWAMRAVNSTEWFVDENCLTDQTPDDIATTISEARRDGSIEDVVELGGYGWPVATETLHALNPETFPILNRRAVASMDALGYDTPNPKSANPAQYWQFAEDVESAAIRYPLSEEAELLLGQPPGGTPRYLIADASFSCHYSDEYETDFSEIEKSGILHKLPPEFESQVVEAVKESSQYRDTTDFVYSALRNELDRL